MKQTEVFLTGEGDQWYERNRHKAINPLVVTAITGIPFKPRHMLEVGCGDGRYLAEIQRRFGGGKAAGLDPSAKAVQQANQNHPGINVSRGTANDIWDFNTGQFDLIIFGFCLYLVDRADLFNVVYATDDRLAEGGYLAIHDFNGERPEVVPYKHRDGINSYHMDYPMLWLANPAYSRVSCTPTSAETSITILQKTGWRKLELAQYGLSR